MAQVFHLGCLPYLPLILIAINSASGIVMGAMLAVGFLKERIVWRYDLLAFILISCGCTGIVLMTKESESSEIAQTTEEVLAQLGSIEAMIFGSLMISIVVLYYILEGWFEGQICLF